MTMNGTGVIMMNNDDLQERIKKLKVVQHRIGQTEEEQAQMCKLLNDVASNPESHLMGGEKNHGQ